MIKSIQVTAINPKYQSTVNRFILWDSKYSAIVDATEDNGGAKQENAYDKALTIWLELPKREQKNISKTIDIAGY